MNEIKIKSRVEINSYTFQFREHESHLLLHVSGINRYAVPTERTSSTQPQWHPILLSNGIYHYRDLIFDKMNSPGVRGLKLNIFDRSVFKHYFISTSYAIYCLVIVPAHRKPSPLNPLVHAQEKLPWLFVHMALMSHGFLEHSSWSA